MLWSNGGSDFRELFQSSRSYIDSSLASVYGLGWSGGSGFQWIDVSADDSRGGLLATSGFLALTSVGGPTTLIYRGKYVREVVLCDAPPPPPANVRFEQDASTGSAGDLLAQHSSDPACRGCHEKLDPIGRGLERYDEIGAVRTEDPWGNPVAQEGAVSGIEDSSFAGGADLGRVVAGSEMTTMCAVEKLFRWSQGRAVAQKDEDTVEWLHQQFADGSYSMRELVVALIGSEAFRYRQLE